MWANFKAILYNSIWWILWFDNWWCCDIRCALLSPVWTIWTETCIYTISCCVSSNSKKKKIFQIFHDFFSCISVPWNTSTLFGYIEETTLNLFCGGSYFFLNGAMVVLFLSMCLYNQAFLPMFQHLLVKLSPLESYRHNKEILAKTIRFYVSSRGYVIISTLVSWYSSQNSSKFNSNQSSIKLYLFQLVFTHGWNLQTIHFGCTHL